MTITFLGEFEKPTTIDTLPEGKIMARKAETDEDNSPHPVTATAVEVMKGNAGLLQHAVPDTPAWREVVEGMNSRSVSVTAAKTFLNHDNAMVHPGDSFNVPEKFADDWKHLGLIHINEDQSAVVEEPDDATKGKKK